jgi:conjugal transfer pilus assembly protein TraK
MSRSEPSLIRIEGRKIRRIQGVEGEFQVNPDKETGVAYLKPVTDKPMISLFVADDAGRHWKLNLKIEDVPAETVVIRDRSRLRQEAVANGADEPRNTAIRRVLLALSRDAEPEDMVAVIVWRSCRCGMRPGSCWCARWTALCSGKSIS